MKKLDTIYNVVSIAAAAKQLISLGYSQHAYCLTIECL